MKTLEMIHKIERILKQNKPADDTLRQLCEIIPTGWQYPEHCCARIIVNNVFFESSNFRQTPYSQVQPLKINNHNGTIEIFYLKEFPFIYEGPFLKEERFMLWQIAETISNYIINHNISNLKNINDTSDIYYENKITNNLLQKFLNTNNANRDLYHDLMPFKVTEILLISSLYDAYIIESEGRFSEYVLGEYYSLNLTSMPRITGVTTQEEALGKLKQKHYDLIIIMAGVDRKLPVAISTNIKKQYEYLPIFLLMNNNSDVEYFKNHEDIFDKIFVWNGDSRIFFGMIKLLEDSINIENDTKLAMVRLILLVEDSPKYYSRYLPVLYNIVLNQTKLIIEDVSTDDLYKILKLRARPKIILATNYEEALQIINKYSKYLICLVTDIKFEKDNQINEKAGEEIIKVIRHDLKELPIIVQSSDEENSIIAKQLDAGFINKNSHNLYDEFKFYITNFLGFGDFVFKNEKGDEIATAHTFKEFEEKIAELPDDSLFYHAGRNHFSLWLMARGEILASNIINPAKVSDFATSKLVKEFILDVIRNFRNERKRGKIVAFSTEALSDESNIVSIASGSLGGKGRGLAFINSLVYNYDFNKIIPGINIKTPKTSIIGTDEFDCFMEKNDIKNKLSGLLNNDGENNSQRIKEIFIEAQLTEETTNKLWELINVINKPLAIRSSGLFEDSLMQPFAGIFETYLLPNNHQDASVRLRQISDAIKLVFASLYSQSARNYIQAINFSFEEEKMAVIIQEVVGNQFKNYFYPHISGVAQSFNYYPYAHMKPDEGYVIAAVGLGRYVVSGENAYRFSPLYPSLEINTPDNLLKNSQQKFYAINLADNQPSLIDGEDAGLSLLDITEAEKHGTIRHLASTYDRDNDRVIPGINNKGKRIINFENILKHRYIPMADAIKTIMDIGKEAMGIPVEIEFAIDLEKDKNNLSSFYILQIKPLLGASDNYEINTKLIDKNKLILYTDKGMGNGIIEDISDIIYVDNDSFDNTKTIEMVKEINELNSYMIKENKKYILIGPGRWGTRDRFIGIPVNWAQISNAKIIVETDLDDFPVEASSGSHFFHNVTSMNVGYFSVQQNHKDNFIAWDKLNKQKVINKTKFFKHIRFENPLVIKMDGRKKISLISEL